MEEKNQITEGEESNKNNEELLDKDSLFEISDFSRIIIFICLTLVSCFSSCDGGIIPQQNSYIKKDFESDEESRVGLFGSIDYIGRVIGGAIFAIIINKFNRKYILVFTLIFKALTLFVSGITGSYIPNIIARGFSGISQVFYTTYLPVWCDQYGKEKKKAIMVTLVQIGNPIGVIIGYGIGMIFEKVTNGSSFNGWRLGFITEGGILICCSFIILFFKNIYFSCTFVMTDDFHGLEKEKNEEKNSNIISNLGKILCNKIFLFATFANSVTFFGLGVIQYFGDKYMETVLGIENPLRFILVAVLCLLGPICGMAFGGMVCSKLGGYANRKSMIFVIISTLCASIISLVTAIHRIKILFVISSLTYLFAIAASIPPESGIIISSLENRLRGDGFSVCNCLLNLTGNFPSSYAFSLIADMFGKISNYKETHENIRYAWIVTMGYNFLGLLFIIISGKFRFEIPGDLTNDETNEKNKLKDNSTSES